MCMVDVYAKSSIIIFFFSIAKARTVTKAETYVIKSIDLLILEV